MTRNTAVMSVPQQTRHLNPSSHSLIAKSYYSEFKSYMLYKSKSVNKALDEKIPLCEPVLKIREAMRYTLLSGGKRVKPMLCLAARARERPRDNCQDASAIEMIHASSLIQDDIPCMDDDNHRSGKHTNHKVFGEDIDVLSADALIALAVK